MSHLFPKNTWIRAVIKAVSSLAAASPSRPKLTTVPSFVASTFCLGGEKVRGERGGASEARGGEEAASSFKEERAKSRASYSGSVT